MISTHHSQFYVRSAGDIICIPERGEDDNEFICRLVNVIRLEKIQDSHKNILITVVMNGNIISQKLVKNATVIKHSSPLYYTPSLTIGLLPTTAESLTIFEYSKSHNHRNEFRTSIHNQLNDNRITIISEDDVPLLTERDIWDFLQSSHQTPTTDVVFIPQGVILRIPVREILKMYAAAMPISLAMAKTFYYFNNNSSSVKRYVTLPAFVFSRSPLLISNTVNGITSYGLASAPPLSITFGDPAPPSQALSGATFDSNTQTLVIGAAVIFFVSLVFGFTLLYWFYTVETH